MTITMTVRNDLFHVAGIPGSAVGPRGGGLEVFDFDEIGTDPALARWGDADGDGEMCCGVEGELTGGIKAPRLSGLFALGRLLHNGSLTSLEQLLCVEERPVSGAPPYANTGHTYGCDLSSADKASLLSFLAACSMACHAFWKSAASAEAAAGAATSLRLQPGRAG